MNAEHETTGSERETTSNPQPERDENGHFRKGNRGGPGNPFARQIARLRKVLLDAVSEADLVEVIEMLKRKAKEGDVAAAKLLLSYSIGKPVEPPNPDTLDLDEFGILVKNHEVPPETFTALVNAMPVDLLLKIVRPILPALFDSKQQKTRELLLAPVQEDTEPGTEDGEQGTEDEYAMEDDEGEEENDYEDEGPIEKLSQEVPTWMEDLVSADAEQAEEAAREKLPPSLNERLGRQPERRAKATGAPMANGSNGKQAPIGNGSNSKRAPIPNGVNGKHTV